MTPYYQDGAVTIYCGDCREILPQLAPCDLLLTDPPYGIKRDGGMGGGGSSRLIGCRFPNMYDGEWDGERPDRETMALCLRAAREHIVWGGNYFADLLPCGRKWLVWDKQQTMPSYSDAELAWTSLRGVSTKMFRYSGNGLLAREKERWHPAQKPVALMSWCLRLAPQAATVIDPFAGVGSTGRAAKDIGRTAVLIEREERFCEIAAMRMAQEVLDLGD